ncbi:hypothetical protein M426DRAFT_265630 [Hypoxylon sp. CI-4A]|nr:hypothetical protein M426DRAFT_265630 [Hypoxylon sp. CI-4A]
MDGQSALVFPREVVQNRHANTIISKIEGILEEMIDALNESRVLTIPLRSRFSDRDNIIRFPASTESEAKKFTCLLHILHMCHEALVAGQIITKRNIYYQNPDLFGRQQYVDNLVDDVAFTFGVGRDALNIVAAYKGLIAGGVTITSSLNTEMDCSSDNNGILIPRADTIRRIDLREVQWILVIEKEATFRGLAASRYSETSTVGMGVIVTGKGYPDLATRQFLHLLHSTVPQVPILALVDFDPSGIEIMLTYKYGSRSLSHEQNVTVPGLLWLGPKSCDITDRTRRLSGDSSAQDELPSADPLEVSSHLSALDRQKAMKLLEKLKEQEDSTENDELVHEIQLMLMLNLKAEIQAVDDAGDLTRWLDENLSEYYLRME